MRLNVIVAFTNPSAAVFHRTIDSKNEHLQHCCGCHRVDASVFLAHFGQFYTRAADMLDVGKASLLSRYAKVF